MPDIAKRAARPDGIVDARSIGLAARAIRLREMQIAGDPPESDAQQLRYLWHTLLALGSDASTATEPPAESLARLLAGHPAGNLPEIVVLVDQRAEIVIHAMAR
jgi:hypothetical protein